jgi:signal transduction histidine kinase
MAWIDPRLPRLTFSEYVMLHEFLTEHRDEIIALCRAKVATRRAPRATEGELEHGVPLFLDQLAETLRLKLSSSATMEAHATMNGRDLLQLGITVAQVVHSYGDICQSITGLAVDLDYPITNDEFRILNRCLDDAIADSVTEYERERDTFLADANTERLGAFSHELRNLLNSASLAFDAINSGDVGTGGSTGGVLARSLKGLRVLVDRSLAEVRLEGGLQNDEVILIDALVEEVEIAAALEARTRGLELKVPAVERGVAIVADRQILTSVLSNLLHNAFKFTRPLGSVSLYVLTTDDRVLFVVEDECGGLAPGTMEDLFKPFEQRDADRTGLGLGLTICRRGVEASGGTIDVHNVPGKGCIFTVDLPKLQPAASLSTVGG